jgi:fructokinase
MRKTILAVGELLWDLLESGPELGGAPANFAFRVTSLGHRGLIASRVGLDPLGSKAVELLKARGMETTYIQRDFQVPTGTVEVKVDPRGEPDFHIVPNVAYDELQCPQELLNLAGEVDCICFGTLIQRSRRGRESLYTLLDASKCPLKVLDLNLRKNCYSEETIRQSLQRATILKLNEGEAQHLANVFSIPTAKSEFTRAIMQKFDLELCLVTLGPEGLFVRNSAGEECQSPGFTVEVVDTCGAGDACTAGFVHSLFLGKSLEESCRFANAIGAAVAATKGGTAPVAIEEIERIAVQGLTAT